jgi:GTP-binding protein EngB required for normal cell division
MRIEPDSTSVPNGCLAGSGNLIMKLDEAATLLASCVPPGSSLLSRLDQLRDRLAHQRLQLAVLGQFKRGKSTFINALLGAPLLPTAVIPLTAIATFIASRDSPLVRIHFKNDQAIEEFVDEEPDLIHDFLFRFVSEEANPENRLGVERVELFYPAPLLAGGTVLIDTPGIGSTLHHNTEAALQVLPECDAALFIVSADPPITEIELDYLRQINTKAAHVFIVINKIDYLATDERASIIDFLRRVLHETAILDDPTAPIFCVSSREALHARRTGDVGALERSGIGEIEQHLVRSLAIKKTRFLEGGIQKKSVDLLGQAGTEIKLRVQALTTPLADLAQKLRSFEDALASIEDRRLTTRDVVRGEQHRMGQQLEARIAALREEASARIAALIDGRISGTTVAIAENSVQDTLSALLEEQFESARDDLVKMVSAETSAVLSSHRQRVDALVESVIRTASSIFDVPFRHAVDQTSFELILEPYWVTQHATMRLIPDPLWIMDRMLPAKVRRARRRAHMIRQADELVVRNAENLRWALLRSIDETFRAAISGLEERLDDAIVATKDVITTAVAQRKDQSFRVEPEVARLAHVATSLEALHVQLAGQPLHEIQS